jgi:hypothetical protein
MSDAPDLPTGLALRGALVARAKELLGESVYAERMGVSARATRYWTSGQRDVSDGVLRDTLRAMIEHRQATGDLIKGIRALLEEGEKNG